MAYYLYDPATPFEEFVSLALKDQGIKFKAKELKDLVNPDFDNLLYRDGQEIYFEKVRDSSEQAPYYNFKINKLPQKIDVRFGCELETCFVLNCATGEGGYEEASKILDKQKKNWSEGVIYHLRNTIIPSLSDEFKKRFTYAFVKGYHARQGNYVDLRNGNLVSESVASDEYKTLRFEPDGSIECEEVEGQIPYPCEIISPILSSIKEIKLLYEGLMINESCAQSNKSMGFHVNVSAVDETGKMVELTRGMLTELIYGWLPYEKKNYKALRGEESEYAQKLETEMNTKNPIILNIVKDKNSGNINNYEYFAPYGLNVWSVYKTISSIGISSKYYSITNWKNNNVIEFRIFPSKNDINLLLNYTKDAINVFKSSIESYLNSPEKTLMCLQKTYIKYKYEASIPLKYISRDFAERKYMFSLYFATPVDFYYRKTTSFFFFENLEFNDSPSNNDNTWNTVIKYKVGENDYKYYSYNFLKSNGLQYTNPVRLTKEEYDSLVYNFRASDKYNPWDQYNF